ncbi:MAG: hypothetical protein RLZZ516_671 [Cyanobacteriota bacterium]|jgi:hypothetical protein
MSVDNQAGESLKALLESNGWTAVEELPGSLGFRRQHRVGDYLWTEELDLNACQRLTYIQLIRARRSALDRALGETAKRYACVAGELLAANVPFRRTGLGKMRAYQQGEALAKAAGMFLGQDMIDSRKLLLLVHKLPDSVEFIIEADSMMEASVHIGTMRELTMSSELSSD